LNHGDGAIEEQFDVEDFDRQAVALGHGPARLEDVALEGGEVAAPHRILVGQAA
jgi:hypothetical protein